MKIFLAIMIFLLVASCNQESTRHSRLHKIMKNGIIRIGTTGDYKPFSYWNPEKKMYEGIDIENAKKLGESLGVEIKFVQTSWRNLMADLLDDKFDIAMSGITRTLKRQQDASFTQSIIETGRCPLVRREDIKRYQTLEDIDRPEVKIGVNAGGENERYVKSAIKKASIVVYENNLEVFDKIATGEVDVMLTVNIEAMLVSKENPKLLAVNPESPFTKADVGYLIHQGDQTFLNYLNLWIDKIKLDGTWKSLQKKWIGREL